MRLLIVIILTLSSIAPAYAQYDKAVKHFEQGNYDASLAEIASNLDVSQDFEPNSLNYNLRYLAGHIHTKKGNYESALAHLKRCAEIKKDSIDPIIDIAFIYIDQKSFTDAIMWARKAIQIKQSAIAYYILGLSFSRIQSFWQAKEYLEKAIAIDPEMYFAYNELGNVLMRLGKLSQAQTAYSAAYALYPSSAYICNNLALCYAKSGDIKKAKEMIGKAHTFDASNTIITTNYNRIINVANK